MKYVFRKKRDQLFAGALDALGGVVTGRGRHSPPGLLNAKNILIVRLDHLGDILQATALPKAIKEGFSGCRMTVLTASWGEPLFRNNPFVDEVLVFDAPWFSKRRYGTAGSSGFIQCVNALKQKKFDLGVSLRGDLRENLLLSLAGIQKRIGYGVTGGGFLLTREVAYRRGVHEQEHAKDLLKDLGLSTDRLLPRIYLSEQEKVEFSERAKRWGLDADGRTVGFHAGAGSPSKEWPREAAGRFFEMFPAAFPGCRLVLVGTAADGAGTLPNKAAFFTDLRGKTSVRDLCLLLPIFRCFVGPDSGPAHLASALGVPTVFLWSGTNDFEQWKPLSESARVLKQDVPCSPCGLEVCNVPGHPCLSGISVEAVIQKVKEQLRENNA